MLRRSDARDPIVLTGIGLVVSTGLHREAAWRAVREGRTAVRKLDDIPFLPAGMVLGATVDLPTAVPQQLKCIDLCHRAAAEALADAQIEWRRVDLDRFGCAISGHMGDAGFCEDRLGIARPDDAIRWWDQFFPSTACSMVAARYGLAGPRTAHSVACASGLIDILSAVRMIEDDQCDIAIAGSAEGILPLFAAGFHQMRVLAYDDEPIRASRPFDAERKGFVMGEGGAMLVLERLSHAQRRGASHIYAEVLGGKMLAQAHHVTGLDAESESLAYLIDRTLGAAGLVPGDVDYINVHGTGTEQNDVVETRAIRRTFRRAAERARISALKSMLGHLVNASGSVELALTALALRDGYVPPTINLTRPDPQCDLDYTPLTGRRATLEHALKLSVAFGGHLAAVALRRWPTAQSLLDVAANSAA
ncbi:MAG: beta-ketoacyl-[acyl-carrier-protein] synthase family protein [Pirellulales bacterium]|nr:beta-ketoacyl-[acyl-carrier-protein] synthase family protein [Pirellulales bacterium]